MLGFVFFKKGKFKQTIFVFQEYCLLFFFPKFAWFYKPYEAYFP